MRSVHGGLDEWGRESGRQPVVAQDGPFVESLSDIRQEIFQGFRFVNAIALCVVNADMF
jgi:hypothetical protein